MHKGKILREYPNAPSFRVYDVLKTINFHAGGAKECKQCFCQPFDILRKSFVAPSVPELFNKLNYRNRLSILFRYPGGIC